MSSDPMLFDATGGPHRAGRVRRGLDASLRAARGADTEIPAGIVAVLRTMADQIDALERWCRDPAARPYDRVPLTGMIREYEAVYRRSFATVDADPLTRALAALMADDERAGAPASDPPRPGLPD